MTTDTTGTGDGDAADNSSDDDQPVGTAAPSGDLDLNWDGEEPGWIDYDLCQNSGGRVETMDQQSPVSE